MNPYIKNLSIWYVAITILALFGGTTIKAIDMLPGIFFIWITFICFCVGYFLPKRISLANSSLHQSIDMVKVPFPILSFISIFLSIYAAYFYTGKNVTDVISLFRSSESLYMQYQIYFEDQNLSVFNVNKILPIISSFLLKCILVYSTLFIYINFQKIKVFDYANYIVIILSCIYFSIARGTSFEIFEIIVLTWFSIGIKNQLLNKKSKIRLKSTLLLLIFIIAALYVYYYNISARYGFNEIASCATNEMCLDSNSIIMSLSPPVANITNLLSGYFSFGIFYITVFIRDVWLSNASSFLIYFIPSSLFDEISITNKVCGPLIDCSVAWVPDAILFIQHIGIAGLFLTTFILGYTARKLSYLLHQKTGLVNLVLLYLIFVTMISLPVGSFLTTSSANILLLLFSTSLFLKNNIK